MFATVLFTQVVSGKPSLNVQFACLFAFFPDTTGSLF